MLNSSERDFPDFDNPPVVETVLSVQFEKLAAMRSVHFGLFWQLVRERFPNTEDRPALASVIEQEVEPLSQSVQLIFETQDSVSQQRFWLLNNTGTEMMQIQDDRFIKNWRKNEGKGDAYPHYLPVIKPAFESDFREFQAFLANEELGEARINQCEVTYVNHIVAGEGWSNWNEIEKIFTVWKQTAALPYPGRADNFSFRTRFPIHGPDNKWIGRLHVDVQPALRVPDNRPMYVMNLTARGMMGEGIDFFDVGRRVIVKSFENLTTPHMHEVWRKK